MNAAKQKIINSLSKKDNYRAVYRKVNFEQFWPKRGIEAVTDFNATIYRVNAYNISTGQYVYSSKCGYDSMQGDIVTDVRREIGGSGLTDWLELRKPAVFVNGTRVMPVYDDSDK